MKIIPYYTNKLWWWSKKQIRHLWWKSKSRRLRVWGWCQKQLQHAWHWYQTISFYRDKLNHRSVLIGIREDDGGWFICLVYQPNNSIGIGFSKWEYGIRWISKPQT